MASGRTALKSTLMLWSLAHVGPLSSQVVTEKTISLTLATSVAQRAVTACQAKGFAVTVVVVDAATNLKVLMRSDGSVPGSIESARRKAVTAVNFKMATATLLQIMKGNASAFTGLPDTLVASGGIPITIDGNIVGAIGVGGATAVGGDEACAIAAVTPVAGS